MKTIKAGNQNILVSAQAAFPATRLLLAALVLSVSLPGAVRASSGNWDVNGGGNWSNPNNWSPAVVPGTNAADVVGLTFDLTGNAVIINDTAVTLGVLNIGDANDSNTYALTNNTGATFTFNNNGNGAQLNELATSKGDTISLPITLGDNLTITNGSANTLTLLGLISGGKSITIYNTNNGTVSLGVTNTYSGGTVVNGGTLKITPTTYGGSSTSGLTNGATGTGNVTLQGGVSVSANSGSDFVAPTLTLNNDIYLISGNRLHVAFTNLNLGGGTPRKLYVNSKSWVIVPTNTASPASWTPTNSSSQANDEATGVSSWEFSSYLGNTTIGNGNLDLETTVYSGTNYGALMFASSGFLSFVGNSNLIVGPNVLLAVNSSFIAATAPRLTISAGGYVDGLDLANTVYSLAGAGTYSLSLVTSKTTAAALTLNGAAGSTNFSGTIQDGPGVAQLSLIKAGGSTQILSGVNTYSGPTLVSNTGALFVNGTNVVTYGSTGGYTVYSGATLGGSGRIDLSAENLGVTVNSGGILSPGPAAGQAGTLTLALGTGTLNLSSASANALAFDIGAIGSSDEIVLASGTLNIGSGVLNWNSFNFNNLGGLQTGTPYTLISTPNAISGTLGGSLTGVIGAYNGAISLSGDGKSLLLTLTAPSLPIPAFSNLTPSQTIGAGTVSLVLTGNVAAAGPVYPTNGESGTVSATINGTQTFGTFTDGVGDFSITVNPSALTVAGSPYTITYSYPGDARLGAAANNTSTALTVTTNFLWTGAVGTSFETGGNWNTASAPANDLVSDLAIFSGTPTVNQPALTTARSVSGLSFTTSGGGWTLGGAANNVLSLGVNGISTAGQTSGTDVIAGAVMVATNQTWKAGTGGNLLITGSITNDSADTNCASLIINASGNTGNVILSPAAGNSVNLIGTNNLASLVQVKTGGLLELGGDGTDAPATTSTNTIVNTETSSSYGVWGITGSGVVQVNSGTWLTGDLGKNGGDNLTGTLTVNGGLLSVAGARYLNDGTINVNGGTFKCANTGSAFNNGGRFALGNSGTSGTATMNLTGGFVDLAQANTGNSIGVAIASLLNQSGGTLQNGVTASSGANSGVVTTFTVGSSAALSAFTLSGGNFISAGALQGGTGQNNFNFNGGTLSVAAYNATNLGYSSLTGNAGDPPNASPVANVTGVGALYNNGGTLAPGGGVDASGVYTNGIGSTVIEGDYTVNSNVAVLAIDLGGITPATTFQSADTNYDTVTVKGAAALGGSLSVNLFNGFVPGATDSFTILTAAGGLQGDFLNDYNGYVPALVNGAPNGEYFKILVTASSIILTNYGVAVPALAASFTPTNTAGVAPVMVTFMDTSSGLITNRFWSFGDGGTSNGAGTSFTYTYQNIGTYTNVLTVTDIYGNTSSATGLVRATASAVSLTWKGDGSANLWNDTALNWSNGASTVAYGDPDDVTFDDTGSASPAVNLTTQVFPSSVTFNNSAKSYTLGGSGQISGGGGLTLNDAGSVTVLTANDFTGPVAINSGTLQVGNGVTDGSIDNTTNITDNGALIYKVAGAHSLAAPISGSGTLASTGPGTLDLEADNSGTYSGAVTVTAGTLEGASPASFGSGSLTVSNATLQINAGGQINQSLSLLGTTDVLSLNGTVILPNTLTAEPASVTLEGAGTLQIDTGADSASLSNNLALAGASLTYDRDDTYTNPGAISGSSADSIILNEGTSAGNTTTLRFADGVNTLAEIANYSPGALELTGSPNSTNIIAGGSSSGTFGIGNNNTSASSYLIVDGGSYLVTNAPFFVQIGGGVTPGTLIVSNGTLVSSYYGATTNSDGGARFIRSNFEVDGGTFHVTAWGLGFNDSGAANPVQYFNLNGGTVLVDDSGTPANATGANGTTFFGLVIGNHAGANFTNNFGNAVATQTGGSLIVAGSTNNNFDLGANAISPNGKTASYTLSGGTLSIVGGANGGNVRIGGSADGASTGTLILTNNGTLIASASIFGYAGAAGSQVFSLDGGTLVASNVNMTALSDSASNPVGTLVNNGGKIAPGGVGVPGATTITGNYSSSTNSTLAIDINGATPANAFTNPGAADYDNITVSGSAVVNDNLAVSLNGYTPSATQTFTVFTATGGLTAAPNNVVSNHVLVQGSTNANFQVLITGTSIILTNYSSGVAANTAPTNVVARLATIAGAKNIILTGSGGSGASYSVLTATNLLKTNTVWTVLATGQMFGTGGTVNYTNPVAAGVPIRFYQIRVP